MEQMVALYDSSDSDDDDFQDPLPFNTSMLNTYICNEQTPIYIINILLLSCFDPNKCIQNKYQRRERRESHKNSLSRKNS